MLAQWARDWDWSGPSSSTLHWSADLLARHADHWDWERLSANTHIPWTEDLLAPYADRLNWATLSGQSGLPWSTTLYLRFDAHWFASLVAQHQGLNIHHLSNDDIATLLQEKPS